ncbi:hypothetical protein BD414DRAFT_495565 [Trametes punicea]|nr:hypothetical protein BD414DRAFT_495565 [Trametes punicea]
MARLDGYSLQLTAPPLQPTIGFTYSTRSLSRSASEVCPATKSLKRKRSGDLMSVTITVAKATPEPSAPLILPIVFPSIHPDADESFTIPGSPTPTEIIDDLSKTDEECMEEAKAAGVKVRDFAYEPLPQGRDIRAPELWTTPLETLILHDRYIRAAPHRAANFRLSGKLLHNLLAIKWVTQEEAEFHWCDEDWKALNEYMGRPLGPYPVCIPSGMKKPTAAYRAYLRQEKFVALPDDIPEEKIFVPPDEPDMDDGPSRVDPALLRAAAAAFMGMLPDSIPAPTPANTPGRPDAIHVDKKRRTSGISTAADIALAPRSTLPPEPVLEAMRALSRSASFASDGPSRSPTPPASDTPPRRGRGLVRTQTFDVIA